MRELKRTAVLSLALIAALPFAAALGREEVTGEGTQENPYVVPRCDSGITIDGTLDEEAWSSALSLPLLLEYFPADNIPAPVETEFLVMYDSNCFYAALRCHDPDASSILAHYVNRDEIQDEDWIRIWLETFNDGRRAYVFACNALGVQADGSYASSEPALDWSWDGIWQSAGRIYDWGYVVEMAIPFNQLSFPRTGGELVWGITAERCYPRGAWRVLGMFPYDRNNDQWLFILPRYKGFEGATPGNNIEITPTFTASRYEEKREFPNGEMEPRDERGDFGLTARWGVTPNMILGGTYNPDFSQIEADAIQLDINEPFALFYEEKRPFFNENAEFFETQNSILHTRTMRDPEWGVNLIGKEGGNAFGAYVVRDEITGLIFPGSRSSRSTALHVANTSSVFRYKRELGSRHVFGAMATDREGGDYYNRIYGVDGIVQLSRLDRIKFEAFGSSTRYPGNVSSEFDQPDDSFGGRAYLLRYNRNGKNLDLRASYMDVSPGFRADLGYVPRADYRKTELYAEYFWLPRENSWHWGMELAGTFEQWFDHDGELIQRSSNLNYEYKGPLHSEIEVELETARESYKGSEFDLLDFGYEINFRPGENHTVGVEGFFGDKIDYSNTRPGRRLSIAPYLISYLGKHLLLELNHEHERLDVDAGRLYSADITRLCLNYQFSTRAFLRTDLQYVSYNRNQELYLKEVETRYRHLFTQFVFSYQLNPRTVVYLGYSDNYYGALAYDLTQSDRTFFLKLGYAWQL